MCLENDRVTGSQLTTGLGYFQLQPLRDTMCPFWKLSCIWSRGELWLLFSSSQVTFLVNVALIHGNALFRCTGEGGGMEDSGLCPVY